MTGRVAAWLALTLLFDLTKPILSARLMAMTDLNVYAWQDEFCATEFQAALDAAKQDADQVSAEFVERLPLGSPAYDAEWTTGYGSKNRLIFVFSAVFDLTVRTSTSVITRSRPHTTQPLTCANACSAPRSLNWWLRGRRYRAPQIIIR